ncbi:MAG TPA: phospho-sugar mutase [Gemmataceae bacterium]|nr:phospho-sugar mutase [Gemmataceae bacterium]
MMDLVEQAEEGFRGVQIDDSSKGQALRYLRQWLSETDFAAYRPQLHWLVQDKQWTGLLDRFYQILPFGTGGRRGPVGIGPNRMNPWTLGASIQGHCEYLKERFPERGSLRVVIAYDVRRFEDKRHSYNPDLPNPVLHLSSKDLAHYAVGVYVANGIHACVLPAESSRYLATPELSFTIRYLQAHGGLNISASHNPPDDNGGKFYDERGGQPVPPDDQIMADLVEQVTTIKTLPWTEALRTGKVYLLDEAPHDAYLDLIRHQSLVPPPRFDEIKVVFTPMHGVGSMTAMEALINQGFRITPVEEQMTPDGQFPNVTKTPNPEVPESMDRAAATARQVGADLVLSTDPDADRLGAMIPDRQGGWRFVTGNEIAALLTHFKLSKLAQQGRLPSSPIVVKTEVTTNLVTRIARHFKAQLVDDLLVGFKYIADVLWQLDQTGSYEDVRGTPEDFVIGCEESHGILVTPKIRDKDAAGSALLMAELALDEKRKGRGVLDYLEMLAKQFGYFHNEGLPVVMSGILGKKNMARMLDALRAAPPKEIAGLVVTHFEDLRNENGRFGPIKGATDAASRNVLVFQLGDRARIILRPSGTEPKAKTYLEVCSDPCPAGTTAEAWQKTCREVDELAKRLAHDFLEKALGLIGMKPGEGH